jgi:NADH-ubiquinone oxidoreductase chain 1
LLGGFNSVAQIISYEVSLALILLSFVLSYKLVNLYYQFHQCSGFFLTIILFSFFSFLVDTTNCTPFDFAKEVSKLVSGFNIEYDARIVQW